jgi:hypothetical protein
MLLKCRDPRRARLCVPGANLEEDDSADRRDKPGHEHFGGADQNIG